MFSMFVRLIVSAGSRTGPGWSFSHSHAQGSSAADRNLCRRPGPAPHAHPGHPESRASPSIPLHVPAEEGVELLVPGPVERLELLPGRLLEGRRLDRVL